MCDCVIKSICKVSNVRIICIASRGEILIPQYVENKHRSLLIMTNNFAEEMKVSLLQPIITENFTK